MSHFAGLASKRPHKILDRGFFKSICHNISFSNCFCWYWAAKLLLILSCLTCFPKLCLHNCPVTLDNAELGTIWWVHILQYNFFFETSFGPTGNNGKTPNQSRKQLKSCVFGSVVNFFFLTLCNINFRFYTLGCEKIFWFHAVFADCLPHQNIFTKLFNKNCITTWLLPNSIILGTRYGCVAWEINCNLSSSRLQIYL